MGKKKAKKRSKILDSGGNSVNIELGDTKAKGKKTKDDLKRAVAQTRIVLWFLAGIIVLLLLAILQMMRQQAELVKQQGELVHTVLEIIQKAGVDLELATGQPAAIAIQVVEKI